MDRKAAPTDGWRESGQTTAIWIGVKGGIISSLCCLPVIILVPVLVLVGAESFTLAFALAKYRVYFIVLGFLFVLASLKAAFRKMHGCCDRRTVAENKRVIAVALLTQIAFFMITYYIILPAVSSYVFTRGLEGAYRRDAGASAGAASQTTTPETTSSSTSTVQATSSTTTTTTVAESCFDGIRNQNEERVDCGGACSPCGTIGVSIRSVESCSSIEYNEVYFTLTDEGAGSKTWREKNPVDEFTVSCGNQTIRNFMRLEREGAGGYYGQSNLFRKPMLGNYRLLVACNRVYLPKDILDCPAVSVKVSDGGDFGEAVLRWKPDENPVKPETTTSTTTTLTETEVTTSTIEERFRAYAQATFWINTYCPTCVQAAKFLLDNADGVVSAKLVDQQKKIWAVTYNDSITNPDKIMSRVRDFDPVLL